MTVGASGSYSFNGTNLSLQPTEGKWNQRDQLGTDGQGHPIYPLVRTFELSWGLISVLDLQQIINVYNGVQNTGTFSVDLPQYGAAGYQFQTYSGCTLSEVQVGSYFNEYVNDVQLLIYNVRT